jgi:PAS domain S-box-containing protein
MPDQEHLNALLDSAPDPMLTVARDGRIVRSNRMAVQFFGYSKDELLFW